MNTKTTAQYFLASINPECLVVAMKTMCEECNQADRPSTPRNGGVLAIAVVYQDNDEIEFVSASIGNPGLKFGRYAYNAAEKIKRLFERRIAGNNEIAASVSADDLLETYGGCIVFCSEHQFEAYISFSGAPADIDEALAFVIGERLGFETPSGYENIHIPRARELLVNLI